MDSNTLFSIVFILIIAAIGYFLVRGRQATDPDGELSILEYGELLLQADQTARIIVRGVQEEWRNGTIEDDQRTHEAVTQLKELYPQIDEKELIRIVKSAVYLLRLGAGKQVDRVMGQVPDELPGLTIQTDGGLNISTLGKPLTTFALRNNNAEGIESAGMWSQHIDHGLGKPLLHDPDMLAQSSGGVVHTNLPG